ncbi:HPP family protein [Magnetococcus sp. PR-3]|uniref:HPP family protein n=1 Tax=Magnetococcus sp. PR-3 TaxID=3120355 RepID=UPI002FCE688C
MITQKQHLQSTPFKLKAGIGGCIAICLLAWLSEAADQPLLMAPFGASCVLLFALPNSPLAQPKNLIGGHFLAALVGLTLVVLMGENSWSMGLAVGVAILLMQLTGTTHPPAGATPLVVMGMPHHLSTLFFPILTGSLLLLLMAFLFHRTAQTPYPTT